MFQYTVYFYDDYAERERTVYGIVSATSYQAAAERLTKFYGEDQVITMKLMELYDVLEEDEIKEVIESCDM